MSHHETSELREHISIIIRIGSGKGIRKSIKVVSKNLDACMKESNFKEISLSNAKSIIEQAGEMKVSTAKKLMELFWESYGPESAVLLGYINCEDSGADCFDVIRPLKECSLFKQLINTKENDTIESPMQDRNEMLKSVVWKSHYEEEKRKNLELMRRNDQLKRQLEGESSGCPFTSDDCDMPIKVKFKEDNIKIMVRKDMTIEDLKDILYEKTGTLSYQQRVIYAGRQLEDENTLEEYNITENSQLFMVLRLMG